MRGEGRGARGEFELNLVEIISGGIVYLCIKNGKVWVEEDVTNLCVVDDLLSAGIPKNNIVLGFHHPSKRALTEFATV